MKRRCFSGPLALAGAVLTLVCGCTDNSSRPALESQESSDVSSDIGSLHDAASLDSVAPRNDSTGPEPDAETPTSTTVTLTPDGGEFAVQGLTLSVPANAVDSAVQVTIRAVPEEEVLAKLPDGVTAKSKRYEFTPHGVQFKGPVTIRISHDAGPAGVSVFRLGDSEDTTWKTVPALPVQNPGVVEFRTPLFSYYVAGVGGGYDPAITSVYVDPAAEELKPGASQTITATVLDPKAKDTSVTWASSDTSVATVVATDKHEGRVTAVGIGKATITATAAANPSKKAHALVTVASPCSVQTATVGVPNPGLLEEIGACPTKDLFGVDFGNAGALWKFKVPSNGKYLVLIAGTFTPKAPYFRAEDGPVETTVIPKSDPFAPAWTADLVAGKDYYLAFSGNALSTPSFGEYSVHISKAPFGCEMAGVWAIPGKKAGISWDDAVYPQEAHSCPTSGSAPTNYAHVFPFLPLREWGGDVKMKASGASKFEVYDSSFALVSVKVGSTTLAFSVEPFTLYYVVVYADNSYSIMTEGQDCTQTSCKPGDPDDCKDCSSPNETCQGGLCVWDLTCAGCWHIWSECTPMGCLNKSRGSYSRYISLTTRFNGSVDSDCTGFAKYVVEDSGGKVHGTGSCAGFGPFGAYELEWSVDASMEKDLWEGGASNFAEQASGTVMIHAEADFMPTGGLDLDEPARILMQPTSLEGGGPALFLNFGTHGDQGFTIKSIPTSAGNWELMYGLSHEVLK